MPTSKIFKHLLIEGATIVLLLGGTANSCGNAKTPEPKPVVTKPDGSTKKPAPTGCAGKITLRRYNPDSNDFTIKYRNDDCSGTNEETITFEQDLNARCDQGDYFPQCLKWYETHDPGMRQPTESP